MRVDTDFEQQIAEAPADGRSVMLSGLAITADGACTVELHELGRENSSSSSATSGMEVETVILAGPFTFDAAGRGVVLPHNPDGWVRSDIGIRLVVTTGIGRVSGVATTRNFRP